MKCNKIVRDGIPQIITRNGEKCTYKVVDDEEAVIYLLHKLHEEADEARKMMGRNGYISELADLLEIIEELAIRDGRGFGEVERINELKSRERGQFKNNIILLRTG